LKFYQLTGIAASQVATCSDACSTGFF